MSLSATSTALLQLEETLLILGESLQQPTLDQSVHKKHIARLKQFYSPLFDIEHSQTGSYYYAALRCISENYIGDGAIHKLPLSSLFTRSIHCLLELNTLSLDTKRNQHGITEALLALADLWGLHHFQDMADLVAAVVCKLREDIVMLINAEIDTSHGEQ